MKTKSIRLALYAVAMLGTEAAFGSIYFHIPESYADQTTASWDDTNCRWNGDSYTTHVAKPTSDARYSLGLFCVAEEMPTGLTIVIK